MPEPTNRRSSRSCVVRGTPGIADDKIEYPVHMQESFHLIQTVFTTQPAQPVQPQPTSELKRRRPKIKTTPVKSTRKEREKMVQNNFILLKDILFNFLHSLLYLFYYSYRVILITS